MLWTIYEISLNLFQGFLFTWFISRMLIKKHQESWSFFACALLTAAALSSYLFFPMPEWDTWTFIFVILYAVFFFHGTITQKLFWSGIVIIVSMGLVGIVIHLGSVFSGVDFDLLMSRGIPRIIFTLSCNVLMWLAFFLISRLYREKSISARPSYLLLVSVLLSTAMIDIFFIARERFDLPGLWLLAGCSISLIMGIITIITHKTLTGYAVQEERYRFQEKQLKESQQQMEMLKETYETTLHLRHDVRSYVKDIRTLTEAGKWPDYPEYLKELETKAAPEFSTGNLALDSLLLVKVRKIKSLGIEFRGSDLHYTGRMNIDDYSLCSLVSNMLDNASEALMERKDLPGARYILLSFIYSQAGLMILCENPLLGILPAKKSTSFFSRKTEPLHGLGISIMEKILQNAGGQLNITIKNDTFRVLALIPTKKNAEPSSD